MITVFALLLVICAAAFALYPLLRPSRPPSPQEAADERTARRYALYREIMDLEFDCATGKLSQADLSVLTRACLTQAAELLRASEADDEALEAALEEEIAAAREAMTHARRGVALLGRVG